MKQEEIHQRREKIVNYLHLKPELGEGLKEAIVILQHYLKERHKNITPERQFILWTIYHVDTPFDVDALHELVCQHRAQVCRATIYNNLLLFVEAGVVSRFQPFPNGAHYFEKCIGQEPHGYQVCRRCGAIKVLSLSEVTGPISAQLNKTFHLSQFSLYAIGLCKMCFNAERKEIKEQKKMREIEKDVIRKLSISGKKDRKK